MAKVPTVEECELRVEALFEEIADRHGEEYLQQFVWRLLNLSEDEILAWQAELEGGLQ